MNKKAPKPPGQLWPQRAGYITVAMDNSFAYAELDSKLIRLSVIRRKEDGYILTLSTEHGRLAMRQVGKNEVEVRIVE